MKSVTLRNNFLLHFTVLLLGFTGILGKLITVQSDILVWYRTAIAAAAIAVILVFSRTSLRMPLKDVGIMSGIGLVVAVHWITFFAAIKLSNVSITLLCLSATTFFVAFIEPVFFRTKISWLEVALGIIIIGALLVILRMQMQNGAAVDADGKPIDYVMGITVGLISAFLSGIFTILNKKAASRYNGFVLTFYEMAGGFVCISLYFAFTGREDALVPLSWQDWLWLLVLGIICTGFAFWAMLKVLRRVSAYTVVLAVNMEPIYAFVLAAWIFHENDVLNTGFYIGSFVIIASIFVYSYLKSDPKSRFLALFKKS